MVNTMLKKSDEYYNNYIFIVSVSKVVENNIYENTIIGMYQFNRVNALACSYMCSDEVTTT